MGGMGSGGREVQKGGDICIHIADSLCCTAETNIKVWSNYTPKKKRKETLWSHWCFRLFTSSESLQSLTNLRYTQNPTKFQRQNMLFPVGQNQERLWSGRHLALKMKDTDRRSSVETTSTLAGPWMVQEKWKRWRLMRWVDGTWHLSGNTQKLGTYFLSNFHGQ